jgi:hypothetical protein
MALSSYLQEYAERAAEVLGEDVEASITVREHGLTLRGGSSDAGSARCDQAEARADSGPCIDAMVAQDLLDVPHVAHETRWASWREQTTHEGFVKALAVPAQVAPGVAVALNLYSRVPGGWPEDLPGIADAYAHLVAAGVRLHLQFAEVDEAAVGLYRSMSDAVAVEQAVGAIMETNGGTQDDARAVLRSTADRRGVDVRVVAESILRALVWGGRGDIVDRGL